MALALSLLVVPAVLPRAAGLQVLEVAFVKALAETLAAEVLALVMEEVLTDSPGKGFPVSFLAAETLAVLVRDLSLPPSVVPAVVPWLDPVQVKLEALSVVLAEASA